MLHLGGEPFTTGALKYFDEDPSGRRKEVSVYIPINFRRPDGGAVSMVAFLDTGTPYLVIGPDEIDALGLKPDPSVPPTTLKTAVGPKEGFLNRIVLTFPADDGDTLELEVTAFACSAWERGIFLGYAGCMEFLNFAVDPGNNRFFFGPL